MRNVVAALVVDQEVTRAVLFMALCEAGTLFSFERVMGVLVGSHTFVTEGATPQVRHELDSVVHEWRQAGSTFLLHSN